MRYAQTRDILLHQVAPYHRTASQLYSDFSQGELSPRNRLMIDFLVEHEMRLSLAILNFMESAPDRAVDYWFKRIEIPFPAVDPGVLTDACRFCLDDLTGAAIVHKEALIGFFNHLLQNCDSEETFHLFSTLKQQEEKGMKRFIRQSQGLADL